MAKYGKKAATKVKKAMHEKKRHAEKRPVGEESNEQKQAIAIGLSQARKEGGKVPKKKATTSKKSSSKSKKK